MKCKFFLNGILSRCLLEEEVKKVMVDELGDDRWKAMLKKIKRLGGVYASDFAVH